MDANEGGQELAQADGLVRRSCGDSARGQWHTQRRRSERGRRGEGEEAWPGRALLHALLEASACQGEVSKMRYEAVAGGRKAADLLTYKYLLGE
eukprot:1788570-Pleurochrysis_carterae.AAC.2